MGQFSMEKPALKGQFSVEINIRRYASLGSTIYDADRRRNPAPHDSLSAARDHRPLSDSLRTL
jgi:outer membrane receptor for Fe3+-dicitrate